MPFQSSTEILAKAKNGTIPEKGMIISMNNKYVIMQNLTENYIKKIFIDKKGQPDLWEIMEYGVLNGGKRIRPVLLLASYELFSPDFEKALPFASALELIHSFSLVHDDLPAMDNDDLRRGKPTCHIKFNEYGAILAGDALLTLAFEIMLENACNFESSVKAMNKIVSSLGAKGMCAGQMVDMKSEIKDFSELAKMHKNKTGALINASVTAGAILGGASVNDIEILSEYADLIGLLFQIKDDMLDITSDESILGKPVLSDQKNNKITFVSEYGLEKCQNLLDEYCEKAVNLLDKFGEKAEFLKNLAVFIKTRNK